MGSSCIERPKACSKDCSFCSDNLQDRYLCLKSEAAFLSSLLRLQQHEAGKKNLFGYDEGQLIEWYLYAKRSFHTHNSSDPFGWGLKLLDELAKVLFDVGQVTSKIDEESSYQLITEPEAQFLNTFVSNRDSYLNLVQDIKCRMYSLNYDELTYNSYLKEFEVRTGFTNIKFVGCFTWESHGAKVYLIKWANPDSRNGNNELDIFRLATAFLHGVARFGVVTVSLLRDYDDGYLIGLSK